jgi:hypothetical protein
VISELAGAKGSGEVEIGLKAAVDLDRCVVRADDAFALAPNGKGGNVLPKESIEALHDPIIQSHKA